jgi:carboxylate-amine ligase
MENRTGIFHTVDDLLQSVYNSRISLAECCKLLNMKLVASGAHPFGEWRRQPFVDDDHYRWVRDNHKYIAHRMLSFGLHVHIGVKNEDASIYIMNEMRRWAYPLLALSANSPYYEGHDTGLCSTRTHLFGSMPRTGLAPCFNNFSELITCYEKLLSAGDITRPGDLWWAIRPQPPLGTVEFRHLDLPTSVHRIGALAAIIQSAVDTYQDAFFNKIPSSVLKQEYLEQNLWRAMKDGLNAMIVEPETGEVMLIRDQLKRLIHFSLPKAQELHSEHHLQYAINMIEAGNEADFQVELFKELNGDLRALEHLIAQRTLEYN